ncbi:MAG: HAD hydrolase-like protein [Proteobacteria bacterium]|nr:HAD hydrolase-like protein [Pseudomonadota bacterium]
MKSRREDRAKTAIAFDFDGTLIDTGEIKIDNYLQAFERIFGTGKGDREIIKASSRRTYGANRFDQLADTLASLGLEATDEQKESWSHLYSSLNSKALVAVPEFLSVREVLLKLKNAGFALFAASGILEEEFIGEMTRRNLLDLFREARGGDKLGFLRSLKERGFRPILFVGDTEFDRKTAEEAGVRFYKVEKDSDIRALFRYVISLLKEETGS